MAINRDKPDRWKEDTAASVDQFNAWFMKCAPKAFRDTRVKTTEDVEHTLLATDDLAAISIQTFRTRPGILPALRMACCPPLAVDRLVGLANANKNLVGKMEEGTLPPRMKAATVDDHLGRIVGIIDRLLDRDIFPWLATGTKPTKQQRHRASTIVADRLCGAVANPIIKNAQEKRQLEQIEAYLTRKGYRKKAHPSTVPITGMTRGTFSFRMNLPVGEIPNEINIPIDAVVQPLKPRRNGLPILIEAKSAGDFTNTNKRRKEEATKMHQLQARYGSDVEFVLFLCGYFHAGYLGYEAAEGIDWIWEHRITDLDKLGI